MKKVEVSYWKRVKYSRVIELEDKEADELLALNQSYELDWQQKAELEYYMRRDDQTDSEDPEDHSIKEIK